MEKKRKFNTVAVLIIIQLPLLKIVEIRAKSNTEK